MFGLGRFNTILKSLISIGFFKKTQLLKMFGFISCGSASARPGRFLQNRFSNLIVAVVTGCNATGFPGTAKEFKNYFMVCRI